MTTIESLKRELAETTFDQGFHWRILFLGRSINGTTDIVSSLSRSLRNLGHHVLDLDLKHHRITDNPDRAAGGNGPVYVRVDDLHEVLDQFRPQVIVCCAGGLTFHPEDADLLKSRGIVLIGLTLSDPDVFPTVHPHVGVFDAHTTNAELSLAMYREAGVSNTVYFPFAIDRGFVTQEVEADPSLAADVICLGHATDRPDRNSTMTSLAENFDVKTYGRGWDIRDSQTVAGDQALQALKMGRIHVNFPLTRAGYVNIKCGVFESVGAGAVIATGEFDEMARFFSYDDEIIGYRDTDDLSQKIDHLLSNPQEYERIRVNGFRRLVQNHLYEHRWMELLGRIRDAGPGTTPWLSAQRAESIRNTLTESSPRARRVILSGFYGARNLGDELILRSISRALQRADAATQVVVAAENPRRVELEHGLQAFKRSDHFTSAHEIHHADAIVVGGGGLWHDLTFSRAGGLASLVTDSTISIAGFGALPLLGSVLRVPSHVIGMGVGPLQDPDAQAMVRFLVERCESVLVRDQTSADLLAEAGAPMEKVEVAPDVVYAVDLESEESDRDELLEALGQDRKDGRRILGLNLRRWKDQRMPELVNATAQAINTLAGSGPVTVLLLPMQEGSSHDRHILGEVSALLHPDVLVRELPPNSSPGLSLRLLAACDAVLALRLHALLLAARMGIPTVALTYNPKVTRHMQEIGRAEFSLALDSPWEVILSSLQDALVSTPDRDAVAALEHEAARGLARAAARVASAPTRRSVHIIPAERPDAVVTGQVLKDPVARFSSAEFMTRGMSPPERQMGVMYDNPRVLQVSLPTDRPVRGHSMSAASTLRLTSAELTEVSFLVTNRYQRHQNLGRIRVSLRIGEHVWTDDLARSREPVQIRLRTQDVTELPIDLHVEVDRSCAASSRWSLFSRVTVRLTDAKATDSRFGDQIMFASAGDVFPLDQPDMV